MLTLFSGCKLCLDDCRSMIFKSSQVKEHLIKETLSLLVSPNVMSFILVLLQSVNHWINFCGQPYLGLCYAWPGHVLQAWSSTQPAWDGHRRAWGFIWRKQMVEGTQRMSSKTSFWENYFNLLPFFLHCFYCLFSMNCFSSVLPPSYRATLLKSLILSSVSTECSS